jgi:cytochrome bd-type quinol oxidase subunit 2
MTVVAFLFVPVVIGYQVWVYRVFRKKAGGAEASGSGSLY